MEELNIPEIADKKIRGRKVGHIPSNKKRYVDKPRTDIKGRPKGTFKPDELKKPKKPFKEYYDNPDGIFKAKILNHMKEKVNCIYCNVAGCRSHILRHNKTEKHILNVEKYIKKQNDKKEELEYLEENEGIEIKRD